MNRQARRAILIPAYNEALTIARTLQEVASQQPDALLVVINNASSDATEEIARDTILTHQLHGVVLNETRKGKANALRCGMSRIDARTYAWIDADCTYPADALEEMFQQVETGEADMVCGDRLSGGHYAHENKRRFHGIGNDLVRGLFRGLFGVRVADPMTGLRVMSCAVANTYPLLPQGFEVEVDLTAFALDNRFRLQEWPIAYKDRPAGSHSKLNTLRDGVRVVSRVLHLFRHYRPMKFYGALAGGVAALSLALGVVPIAEYLTTGQILHFPTAILASGVGVIAFVLAVAGLVLDSLALRSRQQIEQRFAATRRERFPFEVATAPRSHVRLAEVGHAAA